jgi:sulfur carrier protein ThiS
VEILVERNAYPVSGLVDNRRVQLPEETTIRDLLRAQGTPRDEDPWLLPCVQGRPVGLDYTLRDGDRLSLFRLSIGG